MNKIFKKRILRDLKENFRRWGALFLMVVLGMYIVVAVVGAAESIITGSHECAGENFVEDGEFSVLLPLTVEQEKTLLDLGIALERKFSLDITLEDGSVIRLMENRSGINRIMPDAGRLAEENGEIVFEKRYCEEHGYVVGNKIKIAGYEFTIVGIGTTPDYDLPVRYFSDMSAESALFGTAFATPEQFAEITEIDAAGFPNNMDYTYAYRLGTNVSSRDVKYMVKSFGGLISFVTADENPRILAAAGDMVMNKETGLFAGIVVMALFAYVISVFVVHQINRESSVIGTLYALGAKKKELLVHYITLPALVTFLGGLVGGALGFSKFGAAWQMRETYAYFSIPAFHTVQPAYLIIYTAVMPPLLSVIVNVFVINRKLSQSALSLMRNERRASKVSNVKLKGNHFVRNFRIRQMLRELRTSITILAGIFVSLLVFMLGLNCFVLCKNVKNDSAKSTKFEYMYTLAAPMENIPADAQVCYAETLSKTELGYTLNISVIGIGSDNKYFDASPTATKNSVVASKSTATKYGLHRGDQIILTDRANEVDYVFTVEDICGYSNGLTVFMEINNMRELFGRGDGYYNMLLSDRPLDIDGGRFSSVTSRFEIERSCAVFTEMMAPMVTMVLSVSVIIFFMVMYLMTGVMIDRAGFGISLLKIFGYRTEEIRRLYLDGGAVTVMAGAVVCIPLSKAAMDAVYPFMIANVACGMNLHFEWYYYPAIFAGIVLFYFIAVRFLVKKVNRISPVEILKNRE